MSVNNAQFPATIWDGTTPVRPRRDAEASPDFEDWDQLSAELISTQSRLQGFCNNPVIPDLTDDTGGTANDTVNNIDGNTTASFATTSNDAFADFAAKINDILAKLRLAGLILT